jgi:DNA-binding transcriptional ArsR family regulator
MKTLDAITALAALAQESRLMLFRLLVKRGPEGYTPGEISEKLGIPGPTLSFHFKALSQAGLVSARKEGRHLHYRANFARVNDLMSFLTENCCSLATDCSQTCTPAVPATTSAQRRSA